ncbi:hypothetical protein HDV00_007609 [Rhizophlyctis rosea]|nr:hypothetical protein HDV00_007609 [Rhizophlyctis rosea]
MHHLSPSAFITKALLPFTLLALTEHAHNPYTPLTGEIQLKLFHSGTNDASCENPQCTCAPTTLNDVCGAEAFGAHPIPESLIRRRPQCKYCDVDYDVAVFEFEIRREGVVGFRQMQMGF